MDGKMEEIRLYLDLMLGGRERKEFKMSKNVQIKDIKEYLCSLFPELDINTVCLVANGHALANDDATLEEYEIEDGTVIEVY